MAGTHHHRASRSRSPTRHHSHRSMRSRSDSRSHSPKRHRHEERRHHHHHRSHHRSERDSKQPVVLPFNNRQLAKHDLSEYRPLFALYLDIQKQILIDDLDEEEVRGRWKSFIGKWNRGELSEGWYDPTTFTKAKSQAARSPSPDDRRRPASPDYGTKEYQPKGSDDEAEDYGPTLPSNAPRGRYAGSSRNTGPSIPKTSDIREKRELEAEDNYEAHKERIEALQEDRRADRKLQKERLEEIVPRAEAGTRERQLEKKREKAAAHKSFAEARERSPEFRDNDLLGGGDDLTDVKRMKKEEERKKNERELRREEILRARMAEREERMRGMREKEEKTMSMLKELARARFGGGGHADDDDATSRRS